MNYNTFVVSLKDELLRRDSISRQLKRLNESFLFVDAVDFRNIHSDLLGKYIKNDPLVSIKRTMTKGEIGCALSHLECYKKLMLSEHTEWAWIIEDDAALLERLDFGYISNILSSIASFDVDVIILGYSKLSKEEEVKFYKMEPLKILKKIKIAEIGTPWKNWTCGTVSYLIRRSGAEKFLTYYSDGKVSTVADDWRFFQKHMAVKILHCRPVLVFEDFIGFKSSLEQERAVVSNKKIAVLDIIRVLRGTIRKLIMKSWR